MQQLTRAFGIGSPRCSAAGASSATWTTSSRSTSRCARRSIGTTACPPARRPPRRAGASATSPPLKEQCRDMWTFHPLETLWQDVRYRLAHAAQVARLHDRRGAGAGDRHRREHRDLQPDRRDARASAALPGAVAAGAAMGQRDALEAGAPRQLVSRFSRLARAVEKLRGHRRVRQPDLDARRHRRAGAHARRVRVGAVLLAARRQPGARTHVFRGGGSRRRAGPGDDPERRVVEAALQRQPGHRRHQRDAECARLHHRRRHAARLQGPHRRRRAVGAVRRLRSAAGDGRPRQSRRSGRWRGSSRA